MSHVIHLTPFPTMNMNQYLPRKQGDTTQSMKLERRPANSSNILTTIFLRPVTYQNRIKVYNQMKNYPFSLTHWTVDPTWNLKTKLPRVPEPISIYKVVLLILKIFRNSMWWFHKIKNLTQRLTQNCNHQNSTRLSCLLEVIKHPTTTTRQIEHSPQL